MTHEAPLNVRYPEFGAVGTAVADDTAAFEAAIAALPAGDPDVEGEPKGGDIFVPSGLYRLTCPLLLDKASIQVRGEGRDATILLVDHAKGPGVKIEQAICGRRIEATL